MRKGSLALLLALALAGCGGGDGGSDRNVRLSATPGTVVVGGKATVEVSQTGYDDPSYDLQVREADGGTLTDDGVDGPVNGLRRIYTAPSTPGTYHVVGTVTGSGSHRSETVAITVVASD